ncbi:MAG: hypothetical protein LLG00_12305 [Planctomycetaceae bacterium]|nr:hypothetical protein [Planctomycetaceae bacterium]
MLEFDKDLSPLPPGEGQGEGFDVNTPGTVVLPLADDLGTVRDLSQCDSQTGVTSVMNHRVYDNFGKLESQTNAAVDCLFGFTHEKKVSGTVIDDGRSVL